MCQSAGGLVGYDAACTRLRLRVDLPLAVHIQSGCLNTIHGTSFISTGVHLTLFYALLHLSKSSAFPCKGQRLSLSLYVHTLMLLLEETLWNPPNIKLAVGGVIHVQPMICHAHRRTIDRCPVAPVCLRAIHISSKQCWTLSITGLGWRPY